MTDLEILYSTFRSISHLLPPNILDGWRASVIHNLNPAAAAPPAAALTDREISFELIEDFTSHEHYPCALSFAYRVPESDPQFVMLSTIHNQALANTPTFLPELKDTTIIGFLLFLQQYKTYYTNGGRRSLLSFFTDQQLSGILVKIPFEYFRDYRLKSRTEINEAFLLGTILHFFSKPTHADINALKQMLKSMTLRSNTVFHFTEFSTFTDQFINFKKLFQPFLTFDEKAWAKEYQKKLYGSLKSTAEPLAASVHNSESFADFIRDVNAEAEHLRDSSVVVHQAIANAARNPIRPAKANAVKSTTSSDPPTKYSNKRIPKCLQCDECHAVWNRPNHAPCHSVIKKELLIQLDHAILTMTKSNFMQC